ncbi:NAD-dependent epimerase/dehydratase family protein [bacterium]|nr:NAD-dependent epimerase/dehydratase family protein [bacterium]
MSHFIVTGGAGFIGSHVAEQLLAAGHQVTVIDNLSTGKRANLSQHTRLALLQKDLTSCVPSDFTQPVDGIAHLAATPSVELSWLQPLPAHHNNLSITLAALELCHQLQCPRFIFASSAAVYGIPQRLPITEDHPTFPISPYGLQKLVSEQYGQLFAQQWGFCFVALRLFNVFGDRQDPNSPYSGVISKFTKAMRDNSPITIYGDGAQTRDFINVRGVAKVFAEVLTTPLEMSSVSIFNVGTNQAVTVLDLINTLQKNYPTWEREVRFAQARLGDIKDSVSNSDRIMERLKFSLTQESINSLYS